MLLKRGFWANQCAKLCCISRWVYWIFSLIRESHSHRFLNKCGMSRALYRYDSTHAVSFTEFTCILLTWLAIKAARMNNRLFHTSYPFFVMKIVEDLWFVLYSASDFRGFNLNASILNLALPLTTVPCDFHVYISRKSKNECWKCTSNDLRFTSNLLFNNLQSNN